MLVREGEGKEEEEEEEEDEDGICDYSTYKPKCV
jgi:hypothetical protein